MKTKSNHFRCSSVIALLLLAACRLPAEIPLELWDPVYLPAGEVSINGGTTNCCVTIHWNWGDGTTNQNFFAANHVYLRNGNYTVECFVIHDTTGETVSRFSAVTITNAAATAGTIIAFNDHAPGAGTHPNATRYHAFANGTPSSGALKEISTGGALPAQLAITRSASGVANESSAGTAAPGSPLYAKFNGYVDFTGTPDNSIALSSGGLVTYTFTGLNPANRYRLYASAVRGDPTYVNRWTLCEITGADGFVNAHSSTRVLTTAQVGALASSQAALNTGVNHTSATGDYVGWEDIAPGEDGTFAVTSRQYTGTVPGGSSAGSKGYGLTGLRLEEVPGAAAAPSIASQPAGGALIAGQPLGLTVGAQGSPLYYQWFKDSVSRGGATAATYAVASSSTNNSGSYFVVVSNSLGSVTSQVAVVTVFPDLSLTMLPLTNVWKFNQSGTDLGTAWKETNYNDSAWPQGMGVLAQENQAVINPLTNTVLSLSNASGARVMTYYFRTTFTVTNPTAIASLTFSNLIDDGCVVWLNGTELYRLNMPAGEMVYTNQALVAATEGEWAVTQTSATSLRTGTNVLAVEVHQYGATSSDLVMGLVVKANPAGNGPLFIATQPQNQTVNPGGSATLSVSAIGQTPITYQWRFNGVDIQGATDSSLTVSNATLASDGFYSVRVTTPLESASSLPARLAVASTSLTPFYANGFEGGVGAEWSKTRTEVTPTGSRRFLGQFTNETARLSLNNLPAHGSVTVSFDLYLARSWDGNNLTDGPDEWELNFLNGPVLLHTTFSQFPTPPNWTGSILQAFPGSYPGEVYPGRTGALENNTLGYDFSGTMDSVYRMTYTFGHSGNSVDLNFLATRADASESWGLDNVNVYLDNGTLAGWPVILAQPQSLTAPPGSNAVLAVSATGAGVLTYQWRFNGANLAGATSATLTLTNVQAAQLGSYSVVVSNAFGSTVSSSAAVAFRAPAFGWTQAWGGPNGTSNSDEGRDVAKDSDGNAYVTGRFVGTAQFGNTNLFSYGEGDIFLAKVDRAGRLLWVRQAGGSADDMGVGLSVDRLGNVFVGGYFKNVATFGGPTITSAGNGDAFLAKYDFNGNAQWASRVGGTWFDWGRRVAADGQGNCFLVGTFQDTATFGATALTTAGGDDVYVAKFNSMGACLWVTQFGGASSEGTWAADADAAGNCYVAGGFQGTTLFGNLPLTSASPGHGDAFLAKVNGNGVAQWVRQTFATGGAYAHGIAVDGAGNSYVSGEFTGTALIGTSQVTSARSPDCFLAKYDTAGQIQWVRALDAFRNSLGWSDGDVALDANTNIYVLDMTDFPAFGGLVPELATPGVFVARYSDAGELRWAQAAPGATISWGIAAIAEDECYLTGWFNPQARFGANTVNSSGGMETYLAKLGSECRPALHLAVTSSGTASTNGQFHFQLTGVPGQGAVVLEVSSDLTHWTDVATNPAAGSPLNYSVPATNQPGLFFRARQEP